MGVPVLVGVLEITKLLVGLGDLLGVLVLEKEGLGVCVAGVLLGAKLGIGVFDKAGMGVEKEVLLLDVAVTIGVGVGVG